jgi:hypothetical protein
MSPALIGRVAVPDLICMNFAHTGKDFVSLHHTGKVFV